MRLYSEGYASSEDIDATIKDGLGLRWAFMGPFETIDLNAPVESKIIWLDMDLYLLKWLNHKLKYQIGQKMQVKN